MQNLTIFILGFATISAGLWLLHPAAALIGGGLLLLLVWWLASNSTPAKERKR